MKKYVVYTPFNEVTLGLPDGSKTFYTGDIVEESVATVNFPEYFILVSDTDNPAVPEIVEPTKPITKEEQTKIELVKKARTNLGKKIKSKKG